MNNSPTLARAHGSSVEHLLVPGTKVTRCGMDATLMARWSPADSRADSKVRPIHPACRAAADASHPSKEI